MSFKSQRIGFALIAAFVLWSPAASLAAPDPDKIAVNVDQAKLVRLPTGIATIVVGNPLIADVTLQNGGIVVVGIVSGGIAVGSSGKISAVASAITVTETPSFAGGISNNGTLSTPHKIGRAHV